MQAANTAIRPNVLFMLSSSPPWCAEAAPTAAAAARLWNVKCLVKKPSGFGAATGSGCVVGS